jgi:hypothetical protein
MYFLNSRIPKAALIRTPRAMIINVTLSFSILFKYSAQKPDPDLATTFMIPRHFFRVDAIEYRRARINGHEDSSP